MMELKQSHFQRKEPLGEGLLQRFRFRKLSQHIEPQSAVIDLGCGYHARFLHALLPKIANGVGVDLSVEQSTSPKLKTIAANLNETLPMMENTFDVAVSMANLEHLEHPQHLLKEVHRILKPGGKLLLTAPTTCAKPVLEFLAFRLHLVSEDEIRDHKMYFNRKILLDYLHEAGFQNASHRYFQFGMNNFVLAIK